MRNWVLANHPLYEVAFDDQAVSGHWPWSNLVRLPAELLAQTRSDIVMFDCRSVSTGRQQASLEACIRKIQTAHPGVRMFAPIFPGYDDHDVDVINPLTEAETNDIALGNYYGVHMIDYRQELIDRLADGEHLNVYQADAVHPTTVGYQLIATMIEAYITSNPAVLSGLEDHSTLPAVLYDTGSYYQSHTPIRRTGVTNGGTTGTWTTTGTRIESSEAGATVTFVATCKSFGLYSAGTANSVADVKVDDAAYLENRTIGHNGYDDDMTDAEHTIIIKVRAGAAIRIDEFWAI